MGDVAVERISVEPSRRCAKGCAFCYNGSSPDGDGQWPADVLAGFALDCAAHGVRALSIGGGEPLEYDGVYDVLRATEGHVFRSLTTNGLPLSEPSVLEALVAARPDKVHVSIHAPESHREVERVRAQVVTLADRGVRSGVNLLVRRARLDDVARAVSALRDAGIERDRVIFLPVRGPGADTPTPDEVARVAGGPFQSMTCLTGCARSPRFASIAADRTVAWCSYTVTRRPLRAPTFAALREALYGDETLGLAPCDAAMVRTVPLRARR